MRTSILLVFLPAMLQVTDRATQSPSPIVCQYDAAGNRVSRTLQSSLSNRSAEELQFLADSLLRQELLASQPESVGQHGESTDSLTNVTGGTDHE